jgi:uncharacterized protein (TIGR02145 family)
MRYNLSFLAVLAALLLSGCNNTPEIVPEIKLDGTPSITVSGDKPGGKITITVNVDWTAKPDVTWLRVVPESGKGSDQPVTITVTCDPNPNPEPREGKITITAGGISKEITVIQPAVVIEVTGITLQPAEAALSDGETVQLTATVEPDNATDKSVTWTTSDAQVATVADGLVTAVGEGTATITATASGGKTAACTVTVTSTKPKMVDLGLSVKWADRNMGAPAAAEYGDYYTWAETETKDHYDLDNSKWFYLSSERLTKYVTKEKNGTVDNNTHLDEDDDAAHTLYGDKWRLATEEEWQELIDRCTWTWKGDETNKGGFEVTGPSGKSIYLPAAGMFQGSSLSAEGYNGFYWSSNVVTTGSSNSLYVQMNPNGAKITNMIRFFGFSVRPVYGDVIRVDGISLDQKEADLHLGESVQLTATLTPGNAFEKGVLWTSSDPAVATVTAEFSGGGLVRVINPGEATITATSVDGGKTATFHVKASATIFEANASNIVSVLEQFNASSAQAPLLKLLEDIPASITITREDGVIDFCGHTVSKEMFLQNNTAGKSVTLRNGTLDTSLDGKGDWYDFFHGTVILENLNVTGTIFTDGHDYVFLSGCFDGSTENYRIDGYPGTVTIRGGCFSKGYEANGETGFRNNCEKGSYLLYGGKFKVCPNKYNQSCARGYYISNNYDEDRNEYPFRVVEN